MAELFVWGVKENCPRKVLENKFGQCGKVTDVHNTGKGYAFVTMINGNAAWKAIRDRAFQVIHVITAQPGS